jgi:hypothetical protein
MTNLEDELRDLNRAVTDQVREEDLPGLYQRRRRSAWYVPLAAAVAVVVAITASLAVPRLVSSPAQSVRKTAVKAATTPPFALDFVTTARIEVLSTATGRVTGTIPVPGKGLQWSAAAPAGSGTTFVLAAIGDATICPRSYLYRLTLSAGGAPVSVRPWTVPVVDQWIMELTASADGSTVAYTGDCYRGRPDPVYGVIRGHTVTTWPGLVLEPSPSAVSLSANGDLLAYVYQRDAYSRWTVRLLDTRSGTTSKVAYPFPADATTHSVVLSPDGATAYLLWGTAEERHSSLTAYRTGSRTTLFSDTLPFEGEIAWAGSHLVLWGGSSALLVDPATGRATAFRPPLLLSPSLHW